jgi:hypothetical protein
VGRLLGGNDVNRLVLAELCRRLESPLDESGADDEVAFWQRLMLAEACRVKEAVYFQPTATFHATPPAYLRRIPVLARDAKPWVEFTRTDLERLLERHGVYQLIGDCLEEVLKEGAARGVREEDIEDVLMVGGSTLLPRVYPFFEERFGRDRVRAWQPFEAGVFGACAFAAGQLSHADFIVHDYAFVTYDAKTQEKEYTVVVPRGTRFPTPPDFWKRQFVPTCALGEPETLFKLVICEIGRGVEGDRQFVWDRPGQVHTVEHGSGRSDAVVVPLNEANPALGYLDPPHPARLAAAARDRVRRQRGALALRHRSGPPHPARAHAGGARGAPALAENRGSSIEAGARGDGGQPHPRSGRPGTRFSLPVADAEGTATLAYRRRGPA